MAATILLVDDHGVVRQGMATLLGTVENLAVVGEACDGREAIDVARKLTPDLVVIDLMMPNIDGVTAIRSLRAVSPVSKLVVLTSSEDAQLAFGALEAGAHAFLLKSMSGDELISAIERIVQGEIVIHPNITRQVLQAVRRASQPESNPFAVLSEREMHVLRALADGASNAKLADTLAISEKTVKSHIGNILSKLHLADRTEAVAFAWRNGLMKDSAH